MSARVEVSTDIIGAVGSLSVLEEVYGRLQQVGRINGVEVIALRYRLPKLLDKLKDKGFSPTCLHGTAFSNGEEPFMGRCILFAENTAIVSPPKLMDIAGQYGLDILLHNTSIAGDKKFMSAVSKIPKGVFLWVENHPGVGQLDRTVDMVKSFRKKGIAAGVIVDLVHYLGAANLAGKNLERKWPDLLTKLKYIGSLTDGYGPIPWGVHEACGLLHGDSLDIADLSDEMLADYISALVHQTIPQRVVFEYQHGGRGILLPSRKNIEVARDRIAVVFERHGKAGLYDLAK